MKGFNISLSVFFQSDGEFFETAFRSLCREIEFTESINEQLIIIKKN